MVTWDDLNWKFFACKEVTGHQVKKSHRIRVLFVVVVII